MKFPEEDIVFISRSDRLLGQKEARKIIYNPRLEDE
jgi:hypothetical protein